LALDVAKIADLQSNGSNSPEDSLIGDVTDEEVR